MVLFSLISLRWVRFDTPCILSTPVLLQHRTFLCFVTAWTHAFAANFPPPAPLLPRPPWQFARWFLCYPRLLSTPVLLQHALLSFVLLQRGLMQLLLTSCLPRQFALCFVWFPKTISHNCDAVAVFCWYLLSSFDNSVHCSPNPICFTAYFFEARVFRICILRGQMTWCSQ